MAQGEFLTLVWFPKPGEEVNAEQLFEGLVKAQPESLQRTRNPNPQNQVVAVASGETHGFAVVVEEKVGRIDLSFRQPSAVPTNEFPTIDLGGAIQLASNWISEAASLPVSMRVSSIARVIRKSKSEEEASASFSKIVGIQLADANVSDLMFQVNRRKPFGPVQGNWLVNTGVYTHQSVIFMPGQSGQAVSAVVTYGARIDLDFNTVPDGSPLNLDLQKEVFSAILAAQANAVNCETFGFVK